jgi:hypothetical protein
MHFSLFRLYLALASLIGLVGLVVGYGTVGYTLIERAIISDDEYITGSRGYEVRACEDPISSPDIKNATQMIQKARTPEEIIKCKKETHERLIVERNYSTKTSSIGGGVWGSLFLLVFLGHFPFFFRSYRREE